MKKLFPEHKGEGKVLAFTFINYLYIQCHRIWPPHLGKLDDPSMRVTHLLDSYTFLSSHSIPFPSLLATACGDHDDDHRFCVSMSCCFGPECWNQSVDSRPRRWFWTDLEFAVIVEFELWFNVFRRRGCSKCCCCCSDRQTQVQIFCCCCCCCCLGLVNLSVAVRSMQLGSYNIFFGKHGLYMLCCLLVWESEALE